MQNICRFAAVCAQLYTLSLWINCNWTLKTAEFISDRKMFYGSTDDKRTAFSYYNNQLYLFRYIPKVLAKSQQTNSIGQKSKYANLWYSNVYAMRALNQYNFTLVTEKLLSHLDVFLFYFQVEWISFCSKYLISMLSLHTMTMRVWVFGKAKKTTSQKISLPFNRQLQWFGEYHVMWYNMLCIKSVMSFFLKKK